MDSSNSATKQKKAALLVLVVAATAAFVFFVCALVLGRSSSSEPQTATNAQPTSPLKQIPAQIQEPTTPQIAFTNDPDNTLPRYTIEELDKLINGRKGPDVIIGKKLRVRGRIHHMDKDSVHIMLSPESFRYDWFTIGPFKDADLDALQKGDEVEFICEYLGLNKDESVPGHDVSITYILIGSEIHKL